MGSHERYFKNPNLIDKRSKKIMNLSQKGAKSCELCKYEFQMKTKFNSFRSWRFAKTDIEERKKIFYVNLLYLIGMLCNMWSLASFFTALSFQYRTRLFDWKFYTILIFSFSTFFCIVWLLATLIQIWYAYLMKFIRYNRSIVIISKC